MADDQNNLDWDDAVGQYTVTTGIDLRDARSLKPRSPEDLLSHLDQRQSKFSGFRRRRAKIFMLLSGTLAVVEPLVKCGSGYASTSFPLSSLIFGAVAYLIDAARGAPAAYDVIISLLETMKQHTCRLSVHLQHEIPSELRKLATEILVTTMSFCAVSTQCISQGRTLKDVNGLLGRDSAVWGSLDRLKTLAKNEAKVVIALTLSRASKTGKKVDDMSAAGCGKSNLSSTVVEDIKRHCQSSEAEAYAYFYFDFSCSETQRLANLLRSLALQLWDRCTITSKELEKLYATHQQGEQPPTVDDLITILRCLVETFAQVYIIVDALDECSDRERLLDVVNQIVEWKLSSLHLLVTSRKEIDIEARLHDLQPVLISVQMGHVDSDIRLHVRQCLLTETKLRKWPAPVQIEMEEALVTGAQGV
ncbi:MAG: hypothetical protein M1826_001107 [Phylliscum demangeonii]|nr:MAG: hypothetical protein M1826_001107 [Phylliscum demangeonii]